MCWASGSEFGYNEDLCFCPQSWNFASSRRDVAASLQLGSHYGHAGKRRVALLPPTTCNSGNTVLPRPLNAIGKNYTLGRSRRLVLPSANDTIPQDHSRATPASVTCTERVVRPTTRAMRQVSAAGYAHTVVRNSNRPIPNFRRLHVRRVRHFAATRANSHAKFEGACYDKKAQYLTQRYSKHALDSLCS